MNTAAGLGIFSGLMLLMLLLAELSPPSGMSLIGNNLSHTTSTPKVFYGFPFSCRVNLTPMFNVTPTGCASVSLCLMSRVTLTLVFFFGNQPQEVVIHYAIASWHLRQRFNIFLLKYRSLLKFWNCTSPEFFEKYDIIMASS